MSKYLLDTNVLSELLKPCPNENVIAHLKINENQIVTASLVIQEMVFGYQRLPLSKRRQEIERFVTHLISTLTVLPYTLEAAIWHGEERARLSRLGQSAAFVDGQIAATAKVSDSVLVTRNVTDFQDFSEIKVENWFIERTTSEPRFF